MGAGVEEPVSSVYDNNNNNTFGYPIHDKGLKEIRILKKVGFLKPFDPICPTDIHQIISPHEYEKFIYSINATMNGGIWTLLCCMAMSIGSIPFLFVSTIVSMAALIGFIAFNNSLSSKFKPIQFFIIHIDRKNFDILVRYRTDGEPFVYENQLNTSRVFLV
ncbi:hypothetical protein DLAC_07333 [Tieghemostelium lacteum]|uniref:Transmembrane protein n=1 Tax=Tieghemostelium lacteum TaxID=361077 RepID=A0A151ZC93_TIELA|nr:hypothetical protein DLAC_07333 [Tieghemostelium lacteum]|eukprot:KYQ91566.1 hypothetical protein DLAC_07333 [Tieghemostelium lacteum]